MKRLSRKATMVTKQLTTVAMFTALVTVATIVIAIPAPAGGFLNVGDTVVLIAAACLGPIGGMLAGGLGSCFADLILGYVIYAPFTLVIKGLEGLICGGLILLFSKVLGKNYNKYGIQVLSGVFAMIIAALTMSSLYCLADGILYGWGAAIVNAPMNLTQGAIGVAAGSVIVYALNLPKLAKRFGVKVVIREWVSKPADLSESSMVSDIEEKNSIVENEDNSSLNVEEVAENSVIDETTATANCDSDGEMADSNQSNTGDRENISNSTEISANVDNSDINLNDGKKIPQKEGKDGGYKTDAGRYRK